MHRAASIGIAFLFCFTPFFASADLIANYGSSLQLNMQPQYPAPGDIVSLTVSGGSGNPATSYAWTVNGNVSLQGIGEKTLRVRAPGLGSTETITVSAEENGSITGSASALIRPGSVDMVWEGQTATPPFYIGRPLPNARSPVTVLAVPHVFSGGKEIPEHALVYAWKEEGVPLASQSGYGKSSVTVTPPRFGAAFSVSVHVESLDGASAADGSAVIQPQNPFAVAYENAPLLGLRIERAIVGAFPFSGNEVSFTAFPVFVGHISGLAYQWNLDGQAFSVDAAHPRDVTFRKVGSGSGTHAVEFSFNNPSGFLESGNAAFNLTF